MERQQLGKSELVVSPLALGCMSFGDPENWMHKWVLKEKESTAFIHQAFEQGINFFDTANLYSNGMSEEILGRALNKVASRDEVIVATKVGYPVKGDARSTKGLSKEQIHYEVDQSLRRLGMDYIDLYIPHFWDYQIPIEETMEALDEVVKSGKVRYLGASKMYAWQFQKAQYIAEKNGWTPFVSMQNHMNAIYREDERELLPLCKDQNVSLTPFSPLAAGRVARPWKDTQKTNRGETDQSAKKKYGAFKENDAQIVKRIEEVAQKRNRSMAQIALAWLLSKDQVTAPIVGVTKSYQLEDAIQATQITLSSEEKQWIEEPYLPHPVVGPK